MTPKMQLKFNKYWESGAINYLLLVDVFLDPHYKCEYIQFCFNHMYGVVKSMDMMKKIERPYSQIDSTICTRASHFSF